MPLSEIARNTSCFRSRWVEITQQLAQQATAIENRLQKGLVLGILLTILISVKPFRELPLPA